MPGLLAGHLQRRGPGQVEPAVEGGRPASCLTPGRPLALDRCQSPQCRRVASLAQGGQIAGQQVPGQDGRVAAGLHQVQVGHRGQRGHVTWVVGAGRAEPERQRLLRHADRLGAVQRQVDDRHRRRHQTAARQRSARR